MSCPVFNSAGRPATPPPPGRSGSGRRVFPYVIPDLQVAVTRAETESAARKKAEEQVAAATAALQQSEEQVQALEAEMARCARNSPDPAFSVFRDPRPASSPYRTTICTLWICLRYNGRFLDTSTDSQYRSLPPQLHYLIRTEPRQNHPPTLAQPVNARPRGQHPPNSPPLPPHPPAQTQHRIRIIRRGRRQQPSRRIVPNGSAKHAHAPQSTASPAPPPLHLQTAARCVGQLPQTGRHPALRRIVHRRHQPRLRRRQPGPSTLIPGSYR